MVGDKCATHNRHDAVEAVIILSGACDAVPDYPIIPERLSMPPFLFRVFDAAKYQEPDYCTGDDEVSRSVFLQGRWEGYETSLVLDILTDTPRCLIGNTSNGPVFDPFMGSGSALRAAKDIGRTAVGIDIDERCCEIAAKRLAQEVLAL